MIIIDKLLALYTILQKLSFRIKKIKKYTTNLINAMSVKTIRIHHRYQ